MTTKKDAARGTRTDLVTLLVGQAGLLLTYGLFLGVIALGDGPSAPLPIILVSGLPIAAMVALNRMAPEGVSRALIGCWISLLAPLIGIWIYASVRPSFGDASTALTAVDVLLVLNLIAGALGAWGLVRTEERAQRHLIAAGLWGLGSALALIAMLAGHPQIVVILSYAATVAAQAFTAYLLRTEKTYSLADAATTG